MIAIGLDLSLTNTGVVVLYDGKVIAQESVKSSPEGKNIKERIGRSHGIWAKISSVMDNAFKEVLKDHPTGLPIAELYVAVEGYSFASRSGQAFSIGESGGIIRSSVISKFNKDFTFIEVVPTQLKKFVTGKGQCEKDLILKEVYKNFNFDTSDNNIADAYGLAKIAEACYNIKHDLKTTLTTYQLEVVEKLGYGHE